MTVYNWVPIHPVVERYCASSCNVHYEHWLNVEPFILDGNPMHKPMKGNFVRCGVLLHKIWCMSDFKCSPVGRHTIQMNELI